MPIKCQHSDCATTETKQYVIRYNGKNRYAYLCKHHIDELTLPGYNIYQIPDLQLAKV